MSACRPADCSSIVFARRPLRPSSMAGPGPSSPSPRGPPTSWRSRRSSGGSGEHPGVVISARRSSSVSKIRSACSMPPRCSASSTSWPAHCATASRCRPGLRIPSASLRSLCVRHIAELARLEPVIPEGRGALPGLFADLVRGLQAAAVRAVPSPRTARRRRRDGWGRARMARHRRLRRAGSAVPRSQCGVRTGKRRAAGPVLPARRE